VIFLQKRCYAAARRSGSLAEPLSGLKPSKGAPLPPQDAQVSKLPNGLVIASLENYSPVSSVGVFVKAGSRYETVENQGVSHVLRLAANLHSSPFHINVDILYSAWFLTYFNTFLCIIAVFVCFLDAAVFDDPYLTFSLCLVLFSPAEVIEKLHEAAYKNTLSNSLYCPDFMVGHVSSQQLKSFVEDHFTTGRMALVGLGVNHSVLRQVGEGLLSARSGVGAPVAKSVYRGGELRVQNKDDLVHALIASEGAVTGSAEANAFSVLQRILGAGPHVKRGSSITSKLSQGIAKATTQPFDATAFNVSYSDSGLFGVYTIAQAASAGEVIKAAIAQVRGVAEGGVSEADITRAKNQVKAEYLMSMESSEGLLEEIGAQALTAGVYQAPDAVLKAIDAVTQNDVVKAAKKFVDGKKTMSASGHLINTPFVDEV
uniref:Ubiquinol-cytochrome c reductase core protein 2a n=1 Tax=Oreochromis niloticus TaxID=8128 RepID=A0A669E0J3_ORENI